MSEIKIEKNMSFGEIIKALNYGNLVQRSEWVGRGVFLFVRPSDEISISQIASIKSLPQQVKDYYQAINNPNSSTVKFSRCICMKAEDDSIVNGWVASHTDILANDWQIVDVAILLNDLRTNNIKTPN